MRFHRLTCIVVVGSLVISAHCGLSKKSPGEVVRSAYMAANAGQYSEAEKYLSTELKNAMSNGLGALAGGMKGLWDEVTRKGTIETIEILKEEVRGEGATVQFRIHFRDGGAKDDDESLILENGKWKITTD